MDGREQMAQQQPSTNQSGPPHQHRFPFLRHLTHPHWTGIGAIATIIGIVVAIFLAQGSKSGSSNVQQGTAGPGHSMTATALAASSATPSSSPRSLNEFLIPTSNRLPIAMATGSDSNFWFTEQT